MNKEIKKYIGCYLGVYVIVLLTFAIFQYFEECYGLSLNCKTNWDKVKDILQTTAYILTPVIAIIGFLKWKEQIIYSELLNNIIELKKYINQYKIFNQSVIYETDHIIRINWPAISQELLILQNDILKNPLAETYDYLDSKVIYIRKKEIYIREHFKQIYNEEFQSKLNELYAKIYEHASYIDIIKRNNNLTDELKKINFLKINSDLKAYIDDSVVKEILTTPFWFNFRIMDSDSENKFLYLTNKTDQLRNNYLDPKKLPLENEFKNLNEKIDQYL